MTEEKIKEETVSEVAKSNRMGEEEAISALKQYIEETGKSQTMIARELGYNSGAIISSFLSGTYKAAHVLIPKIEVLISNRIAKTLAPKEPEFAKTSMSKIIMDKIEYCRLMGKPVIIYGDAGVGKTMAIKEYVKNNPMAIFITCAPAYKRISGVNYLLCSKLGIRERRTMYAYDEIVYKLTNSDRVIIVDEAQFLSDDSLEHLRSISDAAGIGICFVGNSSLFSNITKNESKDFGQIFSRKSNDTELRVGDIKRTDIESIFVGSYLDDKSIDLLYKIAKTPYGIRGAVNVYIATVSLFDELNVEKLANVARQIKIG